MSKEYEVVSMLDEEAVIINCISDGYYNIPWVLCTLRKDNKCQYTGDVLKKGARAFRPLTNGYNRMDRLSVKAIRHIILKQSK